MPAKSAKQFGYMAAISSGKILKGLGPSKEVATEFLKKTPGKKRHEFALALAAKREKK